MSINVKKLGDGATKIVWKTVVSDSESKNDRRVRSPWFKLERVHYNAANAVQLRLEQFEEDDSSENAQKALRFHFTLKLITPGGNGVDEELSPECMPECQDSQPCSALPGAVWVSINEGNIQMATNMLDEKWCTWQSVNILLFVCVVFRLYG